MTVSERDTLVGSSAEGRGQAEPALYPPADAAFGVASSDCVCRPGNRYAFAAIEEQRQSRQEGKP